MQGIVQAQEAGQLATEKRNLLLESVAADVTRHVLYDNYLQVQVLAQESQAAPQRMEAYEALMVELESTGLLERDCQRCGRSEFRSGGSWVEA